MSWIKKAADFKSAILKLNQPVLQKNTTCVHGEENCARCMADELDQADAKQTSWARLDESDLRKVVSSLPECVRTTMNRNPHKVILAGGYIRATIGRENINDIDLFFDTENDATKIIRGQYSNCSFKEKHVVTYSSDPRIEIQGVWRYPFDDARDVLDAFDYTVAKAAIWFGDNGYESICHSRFYTDLARKMLVYDCDRDTERVHSIPRLLKYASYGYSIDPKSLAEVVVKTCLSLNLENGFDGMIKQLEEAYIIGGSETQWKDWNKKYVPPPPPARSYSYGS